MRILSERLALWFLRLNGFMTIPNFIVHPEGPREDGAYPQRTDVDVLDVRFPFRGRTAADRCRTTRCSWPNSTDRWSFSPRSRQANAA